VTGLNQEHLSPDVDTIKFIIMLKFFFLFISDKKMEF